MDLYPEFIDNEIVFEFGPITELLPGIFEAQVT